MADAPIDAVVKELKILDLSTCTAAAAVAAFCIEERSSFVNLAFFFGFFLRRIGSSNCSQRRLSVLLNNTKIRVTILNKNNLNPTSPSLE